MRSAVAVMLSSLWWATLPGVAFAVDGVVEINLASAAAGGITLGDAPGLPVEIFQSGSYRLTGSLSDTAGASSIVFIAASGVTLDLGGFELAGDGSTAVGISASTIDVTVRNGTVRDVSGLGIDLGSRGRVENVEVRGTNGGAIECAADCKLRDLLLSGNAGISIDCGARCELLDSTLAFNNGSGAVVAGPGSRVEGNQIGGPASTITVGQGSIVARNTLASPGTTNRITATGPVLIRENVIQDATGTAVLVTGSALIEGNIIDGSAGGIGIACGAGCLVRGNTVRDALGLGLDVTGTPSGYADNVFTGNNGGDANQQVDGNATDLGGNLCGNPAACP